MKNKWFIGIFLTVWAILIVLNLVIPKQEFSQAENRVLTKFPTFSIEKFFNQQYTQELDSYINDHFIFRDSWVSIKTMWEIATLKQELNGVYIGKNGYLFEKAPYQKESQENLDTIASRVTAFASRTDIPTYFMMIPNSITINQDNLPDHLETYDQLAVIDSFYQSLQTVKPIDVSSILLKNKEKELYFKTDHHMTSMGAYLSYLAFCQQTNKGAVSLDTMISLNVSHSFLGTLDSKLNSPFTKPDNIVLYLNAASLDVEEVVYDTSVSTSLFAPDYLTKKDKYSFFLNGNNAKVVIKTKVKNSKKLLLIKDSYAHNIVPFLCNHYQEIHVIDPRYYKLSMSQYGKERGITEVLFLYNVTNMLSDLGLRTLE